MDKGHSKRAMGKVDMSFGDILWEVVSGSKPIPESRAYHYLAVLFDTGLLIFPLDLWPQQITERVHTHQGRG